MISTPLWIGSFFLLAAASAFICTAVKDDETTSLARRALDFFGLVVLGTLAISAAILAIEAFL